MRGTSFIFAFAAVFSVSSGLVIDHTHYDSPPWLASRAGKQGTSTDCFSPVNSEERKDYYCRGPGTFEMNKDQVCDHYDAKHDCLAYCEVKRSWHFGKEQPYKHFCARDTPCSLSDTETVEVSQSMSFDFGVTSKRDLDLEARGDGFKDSLMAIFNIGASVSWSESKSESVGIRLDRPPRTLGGKWCGYWTFIPYLVTSCGTLSQATKIVQTPLQGSGGSVQCLKDDIKTTHNWCQTAQWIDPDGKAGGATVFVSVDCDTREYAPFCKQDKAILKKGVASNKHVYNNYQLAHKDNDMSKPILSTARIQCQENNWPPPGYENK